MLLFMKPPLQIFLNKQNFNKIEYVIPSQPLTLFKYLQFPRNTLDAPPADPNIIDFKSLEKINY